MKRFYLLFATFAVLSVGSIASLKTARAASATYSPIPGGYYESTSDFYYAGTDLFIYCSGGFDSPYVGVNGKSSIAISGAEYGGGWHHLGSGLYFVSSTDLASLSGNNITFVLPGDGSPSICGDTLTLTDYNPGSSPAISLAYPFSSSPIADFSYWGVNVTSSIPGIVSVHYELNGGGSSFTDSGTFDPSSTSPLYIFKSQPLWYPPLASPAVWDIYAEFSGGGTDVTTTPLTIYVATASSTIVTGGTTPWTPSCSYTSSSFIDDPIGNIAQGICTAALQLAVPNGDEQNYLGARFNGLGSAVKNKPPFGYVTSVITSLQSFSGASSTTSTQLLDASTSAALAPITVPMDQGIASLIGVTLITWIYNRARHIEL